MTRICGHILPRIYAHTNILSLSLPLSSYIFRAAPLAPNLTTDKESLLPPSFAHDGRPGNKSTLPREVIIIILLLSLACGCYIHANFVFVLRHKLHVSWTEDESGFTSSARNSRLNSDASSSLPPCRPSSSLSLPLTSSAFVT